MAFGGSSATFGPYPRSVASAAPSFARAAAEAFQGSAGIYGVVPGDEPRLVLLAIDDVDLDRLSRCRNVALGSQFRLGERLPGRVWQSERSILIPDIDVSGLIETAPPELRAHVAALQVRSRMLAPAWRGGAVCAVLDVARFGASAVPFDEADLLKLEDFAAKFGRTA